MMVIKDTDQFDDLDIAVKNLEITPGMMQEFLPRAAEVDRAEKKSRRKRRVRVSLQAGGNGAEDAESCVENIDAERKKAVNPRKDLSKEEEEETSWDKGVGTLKKMKTKLETDRGSKKSPQARPNSKKFGSEVSFCYDNVSLEEGNKDVQCNVLPN